MATADVDAVCDVAIIGAGPGGLAAALAVQAAGDYTVRVFDKASSFRNVGSGFGLQQNGRSALGAISSKALERVLLKCNATFKETRMCNMEGAEVMAKPRTKEDLVLTAWYEVQRALLDCQLPGVVSTQQAFKSYKEDASGLTVTFCSGKRVRCRALVGADGATSLVRKHCLADAPAQYCGLTSCRAILPTIPDWWPYPDSLVVFNGQMFVMPIGDGKLSWFAQRPLPEAKLKDIMRQPRNQAATKSALLEYFGGYFGPVQEILKATPPEAILEHGIFGRQSMGPIQPWGAGRVTLLGDAAHVMHPVLGQGTSMAFEDAAELGHAVSELGLGELALRDYEHRRVERTQLLATITEAFISNQLENVKKLGRFDYPMPAKSLAPTTPTTTDATADGTSRSLPSAQSSPPPASGAAAPSSNSPASSTAGRFMSREEMMQKIAVLNTKQFAPVQSRHAAVPVRASLHSCSAATCPGVPQRRGQLPRHTAAVKAAAVKVHGAAARAGHMPGRY